jgi:hypothetical protein
MGKTNPPETILERAFAGSHICGEDWDIPIIEMNCSAKMRQGVFFM